MMISMLKNANPQQKKDFNDGFVKAKITGEKIDGDKAKVFMTSAKGEKEDINVVKVNGKWLVDFKK